jgi:hypothetical protein
LNRKHPVVRICRVATKDRRWALLLMPTIEIISLPYSIPSEEFFLLFS